MPYTKNKTKHILERRLNQEVSKKDKVNIKTSKKKLGTIEAQSSEHSGRRSWTGR